MASKFDSIKNIQKLFNQKSLLDIAIEVEKFLDFMNVYVYPHWFDGEIVDGPFVSRYFVEITLKYPFDKKPDTMGARVLHDVGVKLKYVKDIELQPIEIETPADYRPNSKKPKMRPVDYWFVTLKIPRRLIDDANYNALEDVDDEIDVNEISELASNQEDETAGNEEFGDDIDMDMEMDADNLGGDENV